MSTFDSLFTEASRLPVDERIHLIEALWDTVPEESLPPLSPEWMAEIERRSAEFDSGAVTAIPWEQVRAEALARISRKHS